jgi:hypothetical protein
VSAAPPAGAAESSLRPYRAIAEHAELELELAGRGDVAALSALGTRWQELVAGLPALAPGPAGPLLVRARLIHERTRIELIRLREALLGDLATSTRARRAADGYGSHLRSTPRLDRSA